VEHPLDEIGRSHAVSEQPIFDHRVTHVLKNAHHRLEPAVRILMLSGTVGGVQLREVFNH
jgi:hypothetical protein